MAFEVFITRQNHTSVGNRFEIKREKHFSSPEEKPNTHRSTSNSVSQPTSNSQKDAGVFVARNNRKFVRRLKIGFAKWQQHQRNDLDDDGDTILSAPRPRREMFGRGQICVFASQETGSKQLR